MTAFRKFRVVLYLLLLFAAGTACGLGWAEARRPAWTRGPEWARRWMDHRMKLDFEAVQATPEQQAALRPSYERLVTEFSTVQVEASAKLNQAFVRHGFELMQTLSPEQVEAYKKLNQRLNQKRGARSPSP